MLRHLFQNMKKCPYCKKEIPNDTSFCGYCGKSLEKYLEETSFPVLYEMAMGYLANKELAKEYAKELENTEDAIRELGKKCVSYIQKRNVDLFQDEMIAKGTKELSSFSNFEKEIVPLDYEERIVSIMKVKEGLSIEEIKEILGIEEDHIRALLESSYNKIHPEPKKAPVIKVDNIEEPKKIPSSIFKKIRRVAVALIILFLLGYFGLREYVNIEYTLGLEARERNDNESAIKHLRRAVRFGGANSEAEIALANVYYDKGDYLSASIRYEDYINGGGDAEVIKEKLSNSYMALAKEAIDQDNIQSSIEYLNKSQKISNDSKTGIMIKALSSSDKKYIDEDGNEYNIYGDPTLLKLNSEKGFYQVSIEYDNEHVSEIKVDNMVIDDINVIDNEEYEIYCYPSNSVTRYKVKKNSYKDGLLHSVETKVGNKIDIIEYEYNYDENDRAITRSGVGDDKNNTKIEYDEKNRVIRESSATQDFRIDVTTYTYEEDNLVEKVIDKTRNIDEPIKIVYEYTGFSNPYLATIYSVNDEEIAKGFYIKDNVWIFLYNQKERE